ncbi:MAG: hypothetical protein K0Q93_3156 [Nocardioidaceae bacterium]|jgi:hypothetical protein|nr:hypothetical protein [Nocardioidaceae bacterium]
MYRLSTDYVYATVKSTTDPSGEPVWMAVKPKGIPAGDSDLLVAEWVPGETWANNRRRARVLVGPESDLGSLTPGAYRVYYKVDLDPRVPFEPEPGHLVVTSESSYVPPATPELAAVAYSGEYDDLLGTPEGGGVDGTVVYGTTAGTAAEGNDPRLSDARTPTPHTHPMSDVTGLQEVLDDVPTRLVVRQAYITSGNTTLPDTAGAWQILSGFLLAIPASVGDYVELGAHGMRNNTETGFLDVAVVSGASIVRYLATGTSSPAVEGDPGWYPTGPAAPFPNQAAPRGFTVAEGDLNSGVVTFAVVAKATGAGTLYASSDFPFYWQAKNHGPVD